MSAMLDRLLDNERLADIARNDALMGLTAPAVELDEQFFVRSDTAYAAAKADGSLTGWRDDRALAEQMQRQGTRS
jgi:hypothetical protein